MSTNISASAGRKSTRNTYSKEFHNGFSKAHHIHGYSYCIGEGKYQADRASKLWAQAPGNQIISSTWKQRDNQHVGRELKPVVSFKTKSMKRCIPPRTNPLVAMAEVERPVIVVTTVAMRTIRQESAAKEKNTPLIFLSTDT